ncbi:MAG: DUF1559 domain-containing protein [Planctomycetaceae bacterium]
MPRKPKIAVQCPIPSEFADYMHQVAAQIAQGERAAVSICSDDLLQSKTISCYGGLFDVANKLYGFCFTNTENSTWYLQLHRSEIESIGARKLTHLSLWRCDNDNCTSLFPVESNYCSRCDSLLHFDHFAQRLRARHPDLSEAEFTQRVSLRAIGIALVDFHHHHGHFPPFQTLADDGTPLHSWRSLILPFLDEQDLFSRIRFDEPWDSDHNAQLWKFAPAAYTAGSVIPYSTQMVAVVDETTIWPTSGVSTFEQITSGSSFTIAVMLTQESRRNWMQPADISKLEAIAEYRERRSVTSVFADGHVDCTIDVTAEKFDELLCKGIVTDD